MLLDRVKKTIDHYHLLEQGDRLIVGVSAGVDSMVLLHVLYACRQEFAFSLIVAHVNHGLRPKEAEKEAELVQKEAKRLGLPYEYAHFNVKEFQKMGGFSPQDAARRVRFHFLNSLLKKHGANKIALGHHADDQVETVLLRLIRGAGLMGLKGMLPMREGKVIRPLLEVWREEIESFAREKAIPYLVDSSNLNGTYLRNRIRLHLVPFVEKEYQPNFREIVLRATAILREENDYLERGADEAYRKIVQEDKDILSFQFSQYQSLHKAIQWRLIQKMLVRIYGEEGIMEDGEGLEVNVIFMKLQQRSPSSLLELPHGVCFERRYDRVSLRRGRVEAVPPFEVELISPGCTFVQEIGKEVVIEETHKNDEFGYLNESSNTAFLDHQSLQFPLKIRNFRPGDRFQPLGVKGTQKLKEFFIDHKIPRFERPKIPLLISGEMIAWIVGYRIDERVKISERTQRVLKAIVI
jgi:tRNA(Ile)-lysidine synthase